MTPFLITTLRSALDSIFRVLLAASVNAALVSGAPAPGANLLRLKMVTCFFAAVAMTITANFPVPGIIS